MSTSLILLAGGQGSRMQNSVAKQYLSLHNKPLILHSFDLLIQMEEFDEVIVVCSPEHRSLFHNPTQKRLTFALPGERRQDSVYNGLQACSPHSSFICTHDGARPFVTKAMTRAVLAAAKETGAATVGMPVRFTVKEADHTNHVKATPDRSTIWEIQTPQVIARDLLVAGFRHALDRGLTVTDDVSLAELIGKKVKLVKGSYENIKITVPSDLIIAETLYDNL